MMKTLLKSREPEPETPSDWVGVELTAPAAWQGRSWAVGDLIRVPPTVARELFQQNRAKLPLSDAEIDAALREQEKARTAAERHEVEQRLIKRAIANAGSPRR